MSTLDRRSGESIADHVQRLLVDPLTRGGSDAEIARMAGITPKRLREVLDEVTLRALIVETHAQLVRPEGETPMEWIRGTMLASALAHCEKGLCKHRTRACQRSREAAEARARQTHETRHREALSASNQRSRGDASLQSRGAPGTRNPGGASARSIVP